MDNGIIIITNLQGRIGKSVAHTQKQSWSYSYIDKTGKTRTESKVITHSDRGNSECYKRLAISPEVVHEWITGKCPNFVPARIWRTLNPNQKVLAYVNEFDEGFGVKFEEI